MEQTRLRAAYERARDDLLAERNEAGHWTGQLSTSALSTATAVSALSLVRRHGTAKVYGSLFDQLSRMIEAGICYLAESANDDGGWGDTDRSYSNIATTMLGVAAFQLAGASSRYQEVIARADAYIDSQGRLEGLRQRYGKDKTFAVPILTNCALAGLASWKDVAPLPFELAVVPQRFYRFVRMPVVSYAIPALVAIGQARFYHRKPWFWPWRWVRGATRGKSLEVLERMQPASGGYLEATPLTSFVVMSLASIGLAEHPVAKQGVKFLVDSVLENGSWPIDTNLATWVTTLSVNALASGGEDVALLSCLDWILSCQHRDIHPFTGADPGGWGWTDLSGAVPDADDTPGALLALSDWRNSSSCSRDDQLRIDRAAADGIGWLLGLQNSDGGWPTFCRGWGKLPFDRSGADLTAHALRAMWAWRSLTIVEEAGKAFDRGFAYLAGKQREDGSWLPLWFGNQDDPDEENSIYGTAKVLMAYRDCGRLTEDIAARGIRYLSKTQNVDGGWGGGEANISKVGGVGESSIEETALVLESLAAASRIDASAKYVFDKGIAWLVEAVEQQRYQTASPIGFYFAKLWYYEQLYPLVFTVGALGEALKSH